MNRDHADEVRRVLLVVPFVGSVEHSWNIQDGLLSPGQKEVSDLYPAGSYPVATVAT